MNTRFLATLCAIAETGSMVTSTEVVEIPTPVGRWG